MINHMTARALWGLNDWATVLVHVQFTVAGSIYCWLHLEGGSSAHLWCCVWRSVSSLASLIKGLAATLLGVAFVERRNSWLPTIYVGTTHFSHCTCTNIVAQSFKPHNALAIMWLIIPCNSKTHCCKTYNYFPQRTTSSHAIVDCWEIFELYNNHFTRKNWAPTLQNTCHRNQL